MCGPGSSITTSLIGSLQDALPRTWDILRSSNLTVHPAVYGVVLSGSRGPKGGFRPDSDIDLTLLVDPEALARAPERNRLLRDVVELTLLNWESPVELDTVAAFARSGCRLECFRCASHADLECPLERPDCVGLYKTQKGYDGIVPDIGLRIRDVYPMTLVWARAG